MRCNSKDTEGNCVDFQEVTPNFHSKEELLSLSCSDFNRKDLIKEIPDLIANVKYEVYKSQKKNEAFFVVLRPDGTKRIITVDVIDYGNIKGHPRLKADLY